MLLSFEEQMYKFDVDKKKYRAAEKWEYLLKQITNEEIIDAFIWRDFLKDKLAYSPLLFQYILNSNETNYNEIIIRWLINEEMLNLSQVQQYIEKSQQSGFLFDLLQQLVIYWHYYFSDFSGNFTKCNNVLITIFKYEQEQVLSSFFMRQYIKNYYIRSYLQTKFEIQEQLKFKEIKNYINKQDNIDLYSHFMCILYACSNHQGKIHKLNLNIDIELLLQLLALKNLQVNERIVKLINMNPNRKIIYSNLQYLLITGIDIKIKKNIIQLFLVRNETLNDTILNLGILDSQNYIQQQNEIAFIEQWTYHKQFQKKIWKYFEQLLEYNLLSLQDDQFKINPIIFSNKSLIKILFFLVKNQTSLYMLTNSKKQEINSFEKYFYEFPNVFSTFTFLDKSKLLIEETNILILKAISLMLQAFEKQSSNHELFYIRLCLSHFLIECLSDDPICSKPENNIIQFLQQIFLQNHMIFLQLTLDTFPHLEKIVNNLETIHILLNEYETLSMKIRDKAFLVKLFYHIDKKYQNDSSKKAFIYCITQNYKDVPLPQELQFQGMQNIKGILISKNSLKTSDILGKGRNVISLAQLY